MRMAYHDDEEKDNEDAGVADDALGEVFDGHDDDDDDMFDSDEEEEE